MKKKAWALALAGFVLLAWPGAGSARVHSQMYCWALDAELPVLCEQDDDGEDEYEYATIAPTRLVSLARVGAPAKPAARW